jgi:hypothetical protein
MVHSRRLGHLGCLREIPLRKVHFRDVAMFAIADIDVV